MKPDDVDRFSEEVAAEEAKRDRMWNPAHRWRAIQDTITWAEKQATAAERNRPANRIAEQNRKARPWPG